MPLLPPHWIAHLGHGCASRLGACARDGRPEICRALASQVLADGRVEVLVARDVGAPVLQAIRQTGQVAYVATVPLTHRTLHVKGRDGEVADAGAGHLSLLQACREAFLAQIAPLGFTRDQLMALWYGVELEELACVRFTVSGAWDQTPGPGAGQPVELVA
jgi:hypothetical protein